ncbi:Beta-1,4-glucuronyltransferase 1 [Bulinus truncatus]|nr:Beta-1,4-glucuronyltransferase 1 [Bulinus truncatus]
MATTWSFCRLLQLHRCRFWPCLITLALTVVFLQLLHMALLARLEEKESRGRERKSVGRQLQGRMFKTVLGEMVERVKNSYRFDKSGTYHVLDNFLTSEHVVLGRGRYDVSIVTHTTSGNMGHLPELSDRWRGPVSVSVFTYDDDFALTVSSLLHHHFCNDNVYRHVSFHLVYPISRAPKHLDALAHIALSCSDYAAGGARHLGASLPSRLMMNYANQDLDYPNNLLRNLAINYALTPYIFMVDVDMVPSENLRAQFHSFMSSGQDSSVGLSGNRTGADHPRAASAHKKDLSHTAYVVPVFEIQSSTALPKTKSELLDLWSSGRARPFYSEVCEKCHRPTDYDRWKSLSRPGPVGLGYHVTRADPWEPFYIAKTSLPLYDERFKQYGFNRISQIMRLRATLKLEIANHEVLGTGSRVWYFIKESTYLPFLPLLTFSTLSLSELYQTSGNELTVTSLTITWRFARAERRAVADGGSDQCPVELPAEAA